RPMSATLFPYTTLFRSQNQIHYSSHTRYPICMRCGVVENSVGAYLYSLRSNRGTQTMEHSIPSHVLPNNHSPLRYVHLDLIKHSDKLEVFPLRFYPHPSSFPQSYLGAIRYHRSAAHHSAPCST